MQNALSILNLSIKIHTVIIVLFNFLSDYINQEFGYWWLVPALIAN